MVFVNPIRRLSVLLVASLLHGLTEACWGNTTCNGPADTSFPGPWEQNMYSPASRTVFPTKILDSNGTILSKYPAPVYLDKNGSYLIFDFGQEVGGIVSLNYTAYGTGSIGLAFTEAKNFTGPNSDESNGGSTQDGALTFDVETTSKTIETYTMPLAKMRGGFRYLTIITTTNSTDFNVSIDGLSTEITFQPSWPNLRAYGGYFHSSDALLNRIWYACVYTLQTNNISPATGRVWPAPSNTWSNDADLGPGQSVLVDGAKRDRAIWAGDLGISIPASLVGLGDFESSRTSLDILFLHQNMTTGEIPEVGPPISFFGSDSYHMATMIALVDYFMYSNDLKFIKSKWPQYKNAMAFLQSKIDDNGLLNVTGASGWGRSAPAGGYSTIGNMLMYGTFTSGSNLASWLGEHDLAKQWAAAASMLKETINSPQYNWDPTAGAFKNNSTQTMLFPEDGNSMALFYGGSKTHHIANISDHLFNNWGPYGAPTPEMPGTINPYVESYEVKGHFEAGQPQRALDLIRLSWGWYLNNPMGTGSTIIEGYNVDGSFLYTGNAGYDKSGSYISHAHGWGSGPVDALVSYVVGIQPVTPGGKTWSLAPQMGDLSTAQGGFTTPLGKFSAEWKKGDTGLILNYNVPESTNGTLRLQSIHAGARILLDGRQQKSNTHGGVSKVSVPGGKHVITIHY